MKLGFCVLILLLLMEKGAVYAQEGLFSRQYFLNQYLANPAVAGIFDYGDLRLGYSRQWTGIKHSPSSVMLTFHTNVSKYKDEVMRYSYQDKRYVRGRKSVQQAQRHLKHGVGVRLVYDRVHIFKNFGGVVSYACHVPLSPVWTISAGVSGGVVASGIDVTESYFPDLNDPLLQGKRKELLPLLEAGIWLYSPTLYVGASLSGLMDNSYDTDEATGMSSYITIGYQWEATDVLSVVPSVMYRSTAYEDGMIDLNVLLYFFDRLWVGGSLRDMKDVSLHAGILLGEWAEVSYTYDVNSKAFGASHEIGVGCRLWGKARECKNRWHFR